MKFLKVAIALGLFCGSLSAHSLLRDCDSALTSIASRGFWCREKKWDQTSKTHVYWIRSGQRVLFDMETFNEYFGDQADILEELGEQEFTNARRARLIVPQEIMLDPQGFFPIHYMDDRGISKILWCFDPRD